MHFPAKLLQQVGHVGFYHWEESWHGGRWYLLSLHSAWWESRVMPGGDRSRASASVTGAGYCPLVATDFAHTVSASQSTFGLDGAVPPGAQMRPEAQRKYLALPTAGCYIHIPVPAWSWLGQGGSTSNMWRGFAHKSFCQGSQMSLGCSSVVMVTAQLSPPLQPPGYPRFHKTRQAPKLMSLADGSSAHLFPCLTHPLYPPVVCLCMPAVLIPIFPS